MPTRKAGPTYEALKLELRERIADLEEEVVWGREQLAWMERRGMQGEPAYRHAGEACERAADLLDMHLGDLEDRLEREEPPTPDWW